MKNLQRMLKAANAVLVREGKHRIYRLPGGAILVTSKSPGDKKAERNACAVLRRILERRCDV